MELRPWWWFALLGVMLGAVTTAAGARQADGSTQDKAAIAKNAEAFVEAFQKADAKAVAAFWTPDGDYTSQTGRSFKGREAIEKAFQAFFSENKNLKVRIDSDTLRFVTPDVAIEDGTTEVLAPDGGPPSRARYTIVHVRKDGRWLMSSVRDAAILPVANTERLRGLEWAIGDWTGNTMSGEVERLSFNWAENQSFIVASFKTTSKSVALAGATVWIGWDPLSKNVRSWIFDSTGGYGEGTWTADGKKWVVKTSTVLQDGKKATASYVLAPGDGETLGFQVKDRTIDGKAIPDVKEIKLKRVSQP